METATDNKNRTVGEIRHSLSKFGGNLGESGSVSWMFAKTGTIVIPRAAIAEERLLDLILESGADDLRTDDPEFFEVRTSPEDFETCTRYVSECEYLRSKTRKVR